MCDPCKARDNNAEGHTAGSTDQRGLGWTSSVMYDKIYPLVDYVHIDLSKFLFLDGFVRTSTAGTACEWCLHWQDVRLILPALLDFGIRVDQSCKEPCFDISDLSGRNTRDKVPMMIAPTEKIVAGVPKKMRPDSATGSLFNAPTMEYVVEDVTRTHHAEQ